MAVRRSGALAALADSGLTEVSRRRTGTLLNDYQAQKPR